MLYTIAGFVFSLFSAFLCGFLVRHTLCAVKHEIHPESPKNTDKQDDNASIDAQFLNMMRYTGEKQHDD